MREDMFKIIIERPRLRRGDWLGGGKEVGFRQHMASEERPHRMGMRAGHRIRKWPNENLAPLKRFLMSCVGRPWSKVRSELLAHIDQRNTVQQHILAHVDGYVLTEVRALPRSESQPGKRGWLFEYQDHWVKGRWRRVEDSRALLFVDPRTGMLRQTQSLQHLAQEKREKLQRQCEERESSVRVLEPTPAQRAAGHSLQLHRVDGIWYEVVYAKTPEASHAVSPSNNAAKPRIQAPKVWCVFKKAWVTSWIAAHYAIAKRQLSHGELVKRGLTSSN